MKNSFNKINLSYEAKQRIINNCVTEANKKDSFARIPLKYIAIVATFIIISTISILSIGAATDVFRINLKIEEKPHISEENLYTEDDHSVTNKDGYILSCNGFAGDSSEAYFDLTLVHKNNTPIVKLEENERIDSFNLIDSYLEFDNGHKLETYCTLLPDSTEYKLHFELSVLFLNKDIPYIGQKAELFVSGINIQISSPNEKRNTICELNDSIEVNIIVNNTLRTVNFEENEFEILNGGIKLKRGELTATRIEFFGDCFIEGPIYELNSVLCEAYLIYDNIHVQLGIKPIAGSIDGEFVIGWWNETIVDPEKVTGIFIDGKLISID